MKINTDGVLLGALANADRQPHTLLDIGTGTGVIALMLAQRFPDTQIDAVEIDEAAAITAGYNFSNSVFADRLNIYPTGFESFFGQIPDKKYDLIVSNPPFYINSLESPGVKKSLAKHTNAHFFEALINGITNHLTDSGLCWLILPVTTAQMVKNIAVQHQLYPCKTIALY
jgi:tRNA1Val (adenine37-N6)-methyltransferase